MAYLPQYQDSIVRIEGLPRLIVQSESGECDIVGDLDYGIFDQIKKRDFAKGRNILRRYCRKVETHDVKDEEEFEYLDSIVRLSQPMDLDLSFDRNTLYTFLEISERMNKRIIIKDDGETWLEISD